MRPRLFSAMAWRSPSAWRAGALAARRAWARRSASISSAKMRRRRSRMSASGLSFNCCRRRRSGATMSRPKSAIAALARRQACVIQAGASAEAKPQAEQDQVDVVAALVLQADQRVGDARPAGCRASAKIAKRNSPQRLVLAMRSPRNQNPTQCVLYRNLAQRLTPRKRGLLAPPRRAARWISTSKP